MTPFKSFKTFLNEQTIHNHLEDFINHSCQYLNIENIPEINLIDDKTAAMENRSFASYAPGECRIEVNIAGRHPADIMRSLAHELVHHKQFEEGRLNVEEVREAGATGSDFENEANSEAGIIMRNYAQMNGNIFESK